MSDLTEQQLQQLDEQMRSRVRELRGEIERGNHEQDDFLEVASEVPDPGDSSFAMLTVDLGNAAIERDTMETRSIEAALARMEDGSYGECVDCSYDIPVERLLVQPAAERCVKCQDIYEKTHADAGKGVTM